MNCLFKILDIIKFDNIKFYSIKKAKIYFLLAFLLLLSACGSFPIEIKQLTRELSIEEGDKATVVWKFKNALLVKTDYDNKLYNPIDSIVLQPQSATVIKITAFSSEKDSLIVFSNIEIRKKLEKFTNGEIHRGPLSVEEEASAESQAASYFKKGELDYSRANPPVNFKTVGAIYPYYSPNSCLMKALILDEQGNFLRNIDEQDALQIEAKTYCGEDEYSQSINKIELIDDTTSDFYSDNLIILDLSSKSRNHFQVYQQILQFAKQLSSKDNLGFSMFNQSYRQIVPISEAEAANLALSNTALPEKSGLNSLLSSIRSAIYQLKGNSSDKKNVIVISSSSDDCSFNVDINELVQLARRNEVSIYSIGLGNEIDGYGLRFLSSATGGRHYILEEQELSLIKDALSEILFSQRTYYQFEMPLSFHIDKCTEIKAKIDFSLNSTKISDETSIFLKEDLKYYPRFIIALYDQNKFNIESEYKQNAINIADYLLLNNSTKIEIIGHSSDDEDDQEIASLRAAKLMEELLSLGANAEQIKVKSEKTTKPIYFEPSDKFQEKYNRRVEVKILDPKQLPYQISAERTEIESEAALLTNIWEKMGYRSYFERVIIKNNPEYQVKIWGYPTFEQAAAEADKINKLFDKNFRAE
ncbi:MAG: VWA domain-containing protein [Ignavibacteria bacterium]|nr:VWA domain-containing protein [Ignavibacteria bacterium]